MNRYRQQFPTKALFVVIHVNDEEQALRNARIAFRHGVDGIFLINHVTEFFHLLDVYKEVRKKYSDQFVGLNFLDLPTKAAIGCVPSDASALWVDDGGIFDRMEEPAALARSYQKERDHRTDWDGLYFGSVAFKGQPSVNDPAFVAQLAQNYMDVVVTSGPGTGQAADPQKIIAMRRAIPDHPFGLASGVTRKNYQQFADHTDCILISTGVNIPGTDELDGQRLTGMVAAVAMENHCL